ncbi:hypothetical protein RIF23_16765 [Lipingzhangella sp. LS1_29]|uniref:Uncharacterized protein n=1 Tax=Lipingzhangella rawalii TaxID=2055835 RepID=A0ABU2H9G1_9ACTN|nr:hypothetical protein [Lipingzhangella rawalii]MDS1271947.1 hypothetical protein [Lipingzhangella rawalii]
MSLLLILVGTALVSIALFNRVPQFRSRGAVTSTRPPATPSPSPLVSTAPARLTEAGRATVTTVGGSVLLIALFLALSGL